MSDSMIIIYVDMHFLRFYCIFTWLFFCFN